MLTLKRRMRGGTMKHLGAQFDLISNRDIISLDGTVIAGTFRLLFNGSLQDGDYHVMGGSKDAETLIRDLAATIYKMKARKHSGAFKDQNEMALVILKQIVEDMEGESNG